MAVWLDVRPKPYRPFGTPEGPKEMIAVDFGMKASGGRVGRVGRVNRESQSPSVIRQH